MSKVAARYSHNERLSLRSMELTLTLCYRLQLCYVQVYICLGDMRPLDLLFLIFIIRSRLESAKKL